MEIIVSSDRVSFLLGITAFLLACAILEVAGGWGIGAAAFFLGLALLPLTVFLVDRATVGANRIRVDEPAPFGGGFFGAGGPGAEWVAETWPLTPSEIVYLAGDRFAPPGGLLDGYRLAGSARRVEKGALAKKAWVAALLAGERAGALWIGIGPRKGVLGIGTFQGLVARPTRRPNPFPDETLESQVLQALSRSNDVRRAVREMLNGHDDRCACACHAVGRALAERGLLVIERRQRLGILPARRVRVPERTAALAEAGVAGAQALLAAWEAEHPNLWRTVVDEVTRGVEGEMVKPPE